MILLQSDRRGFTMVELIVAIAIIGILAAIAIPRYIDMTAKARQGGRDGIAGNLKAAANIAYADAVINGTTIIDATSVYGHLAETGGLTFAGTVFTATINNVAYTWTFFSTASIGNPSPTT